MASKEKALNEKVNRINEKMGNPTGHKLGALILEVYKPDKRTLYRLCKVLEADSLSTISTFLYSNEMNIYLNGILSVLWGDL